MIPDLDSCAVIKSCSAAIKPVSPPAIIIESRLHYFAGRVVDTPLQRPKEGRTALIKSVGTREAHANMPIISMLLKDALNALRRILIMRMHTVRLHMNVLLNYKAY